MWTRRIQPKIVSPVLLMLALFSLSSFAEAPEKFERAMVLTGGKLRVGTFLGAVAEAIDEGQRPDLLITTCGASLAGAIMNTSKNPEDWKTFVESKEFYEFMKSVKTNPEFNSPTPMLKGLGGMLVSQFYEDTTGRPSGKVPDIFSRHIVNLPRKTDLPLLNHSFSNRGIPVVMIASKVNFNASDVGNLIGDRKLYQQVFFTDPETAKRLKGMPSPIAEDFPESSVGRETRTFTDFPLYTAARSSMSEPSLVPLMHIDGSEPMDMLAGSVDTFPLKLSGKLANHLMATAGSPEGDIGRLAFRDTFNYDLLKKLKTSLNAPADHWIDFTDVDSLDAEGTYGPKLVLQSQGLRVVDEFPETHEGFIKIMRAQWAFGKARAREAMGTPIGSHKHILDDGAKQQSTFGVKSLSVGASQTIHLFSAPLVTLAALCERLPEGDERTRCFANAGPTLLQGAPFLLGHGVLTYVMGKLKERFLPGKTTSPRNALVKVADYATGASNYGTAVRLVGKSLAWSAKQSCARAMAAMGAAKAAFHRP